MLFLIAYTSLIPHWLRPTPMLTLFEPSASRVVQPYQSLAFPLDVADSFPVFALRLRHRDALRRPCPGRRPGSVVCGQR